MTTYYVPTTDARSRSRITDPNPVRQFALNAAVDLACSVPSNVAHYAVEDAVRALLALARTADTVAHTDDAARQLGVTPSPSLPTAGSVTCTYGGDCPEPARYAVTRTDTGPHSGDRAHRAYACTDHRDYLIASQSRYVSGWGDVTCTVARLPEPAAPTVAAVLADLEPDPWQTRAGAEPAPDPETGRPGYLDRTFTPAAALPDGRWTVLPRLDPRKARHTFDVDHATGHPSRAAATLAATDVLRADPDVTAVDLLDYGTFVTAIYRETAAAAD